MFVRDFADHKILRRITLLYFPKCIESSPAYLAVGTKEGRVLVYRHDDKYAAPIAGLREVKGRASHYGEVECVGLFGGKQARLVSGGMKEIGNWDLRGG